MTIEDEEDAELEIKKRCNGRGTWVVAVNVVMALLLVAIPFYRPVMRWWNRPTGVVGFGECRAMHDGFVSQFKPRVPDVNGLYVCVIDGYPYYMVYP